MDNQVYYTSLYDYYKELLTDRERTYFEDYYFKNYSYSEISSKYNVTRNAVYNLINHTKNMLLKYENSLHIMSKTREIEDLLDNSIISNKIKNILEK